MHSGSEGLAAREHKLATPNTYTAAQALGPQNSKTRTGPWRTPWHCGFYDFSLVDVDRHIGRLGKHIYYIRPLVPLSQSISSRLFAC